MIYTIQYPSHYLGGYAVIDAPNPFEAIQRLVETTGDMNLAAQLVAEDCKPFPAENETVRILFNGDY